MAIQAKLKQITLPLHEYLEDLWSFRDRVQADDDKAILISAIDKDEQYCHVEFPSAENGLKFALIWRKSEWLTTARKRAADKKQSAIDRHTANVFIENRDRVAKILAGISGMRTEDCIDLATNMVRKNPKVASELGAKIERTLTYEELQKKGIV